MEVNLIRVPDTSSIDDNLDEPLGLLYMAGALRQAGFGVRVTNLAGHSIDSWKPEIKEADLYAIQLYTPTAHIGVAIAKFIKEKFPGKPVICGGAHPSALPPDEVIEAFDKIIIGEGERAIVEIANAYKEGKELPKLIKYPLIEDLDSLSFPARDLVDMMAFTRKVDGNRCFGIVGSRGCHYKCTFCDRSLMGNKVRWRSVDNVVKEIKEIISVYDVRNFEFFDDMFTCDKKRLIEFKEKVKDLNISYRCNGRADVLDPEVYALLKESGCTMICFGIESGSQRMLNLMRKGTTVEKNYMTIKFAQDAGLIATGYFIVGFPGETKESIQETMEFVKKSNIDQAQFYTFIPLPGNYVAQHPEEYGITRLSKDYSEYYHVTGEDGHGGKIIDTPFLTADEVQEEMKKIREFLRTRKSRGPMQDYYKNKLKYNIEEKGCESHDILDGDIIKVESIVQANK